MDFYFVIVPLVLFIQYIYIFIFADQKKKMYLKIVDL